MKEFKLNSILKIGSLLLLLAAGFSFAAYIWNSKRNLNKVSKLKNTFIISTLNETIEKIENIAFPSKINAETSENYYLQLSKICRLFFNKIFYIKATEMTSRELSEHFASIGIETKLIKSWTKISQIGDRAKYANYIPPVNQFNADKKEYIKLITSFNKFNEKPLNE